MQKLFDIALESDNGNTEFNMDQIELEALKSEVELNEIMQTLESFVEGEATMARLEKFVEAYDSETDDKLAQISMESILDTVGLEVGEISDFVQEAEDNKEGIFSKIKAGAKSMWDAILNFFSRLIGNVDTKSEFIAEALKITITADMVKAWNGDKAASIKTNVDTSKTTAGASAATFKDAPKSRTEIDCPNGSIVIKDGKAKFQASNQNNVTLDSASKVKGMMQLHSGAAAEINALKKSIEAIKKAETETKGVKDLAAVRSKTLHVQVVSMGVKSMIAGLNFSLAVAKKVKSAAK